MALFFTRRSYNAQKKKFTDNPASLTRYVEVTASNSGATHTGGAMPKKDWLKKVQAAGGNTEVLIYVHGFNTSQSGMLKRLAKIEAGVKANGFNGAVVAYDWPSDGSVFAYNRDRADAKKTAPHFVGDGILPLLNLSPRPKIHLIAHSMGALVVLRAFSDFGDGALGNWGVDQAMFCSADVDAAWLEKGAWGSLVLQKRSARFTNYYSGRDQVLAFAGGFIHGGRDRAGHVGMPKIIDNKSHDIYCNAQYLKHVPSADQKPVYSHRWWFDDTGFYRDMALTIQGRSATDLPTRRPTNETDLALLT